MRRRMVQKASKSILDSLIDSDKQLLRAMYSRRCLSKEQISRYFYEAESFCWKGYAQDRLKWLISAGLLVELKDSAGVYSLSVAGVHALSNFFPDCKTVPSKLHPSKHIMNHQLHLNELSLMIERSCYFPDTWYLDGKWAPNFTVMYPDGVFECPDGSDFILEMDMGVERGTDLKGKWQKYRNYFSARDYYLHREKPLVVLFAIEGVMEARIEQRRRTILKSLSKMIFDYLGCEFDCYVESSQRLAEICKQISNGYDFGFSAVADLLERRLGLVRTEVPPELTKLCRQEFCYLAGETGGLLVESYLDRRISTLCKIAYFEHNSSYIRTFAGREVPMVVVLPDENMIVKDLRVCDILTVKDVYYTTIERVKNLPFHEAVFQFDQTGNRYHFESTAFCERVYERGE